MAKSIMIQGTMSSAGKSYIVTGLCRYYARLGYKVAPFKSQNMALNSYITKDGFEMGRAQVVQAQAAGIEPNVYMNPVLLKPTTDVGSQVIVEGKSIGNMRAKEYYAYKKSLIPNILHAYNVLAEENDIIIIEGAGSPAEINLRENDIVNMGLAQMLDVPVILVGDIDPGGVFAQLAGTLDLLTEDEKNRIKGLIINKFRGDVNLLRPGLDMLEARCGKRVLGVVPMSKAKIEEEDSITSAFNSSLSENSNIDIAVIRLPRISNFTDFEALNIIDGVSVRYVTKPSEMLCPDMIILPGTKSTISDLRWIKENGIFDMLRGLAHEIPICGICGGYQMLGKEISDPYQVEGGGLEEGLGLLQMKTTLGKEKTTKQVNGTISGAYGFFNVLNGCRYEGYEIHNGVSEVTAESSASYFVWGTYVHGIFDNKEVAEQLISSLLQRKGLESVSLAGESSLNEYRMKQYDIIADTLQESIDFDAFNKILFD